MHTLGNWTTRDTSLMILERAHRLPGNPALEAMVADFDAAVAGMIRAMGGMTLPSSPYPRGTIARRVAL